jgi:hypothetical protein
MNHEQAVNRVTKEPTPAGKRITTDETFELFAALVPDSPWSTRLLKIRDIFNDLAIAATVINELDAEKGFCEAQAADPELANDPDMKRFLAATQRLKKAMSGVETTLATGDTLPPLQPTPPPPAPRAENLVSAHPLIDVDALADACGAMRYRSDVPNFGPIEGWSFRDEQLTDFVARVLTNPDKAFA